MDRSELQNIVTKLTKQVSDNQSLVINNETRFDEMENWDSLNTVDLEMDVESQFNIEFQSGEFQTYKSVKNLLDAIEKKVTLS